MARPRRLFNLAAVQAVLLGLAAAGAPLAAQLPPDADWRTLETEHFRITFPAHLEPLGRRAAGRVEAAWDGLAKAFIEPPEGTIDVVLTDHTDVSNGYAQLVPSNRIVVFAHPPADDLGLGHFDDWMEVVLTHELAHIVHLDETDVVLGEALRAIFGRMPSEWPLFPGLATPRWLTEGLATWYESHLTAAGRLRGTFHEMQVRTAVIEGRFEDVGQASGSSPLWPNNRAYVYGSMFFQHLLDFHGEAKMAAFAEAIAGQWVPYRLDAAGREAFGVSISDAWRAWADSLRTTYADLDAHLSKAAPVTEAEQLTEGARWALTPQIAPDGARLAFVRSDGRSDIQLRLSDPVGAEGHSLARVNGLATFDWLPDGRLLVAQMEYQGPYRTYSDLYLVDGSGSSRRLTDGERLTHPSASPDGAWAVAVQHDGGTNRLVRFDLEDGTLEELAAPSPDVHWAYPQVSPDGRWVAATRWESGAYHDVVVVDAATGAVAAEVTNDRALDHAPVWSPDGRWLVWASDRSGILNVLAAPFEPGSGQAGAPLQLTNVRTGAAYPSVDPSGEWLYFSGYHVDGWEIERVPFRPSEGVPAPPIVTRFEPGPTTGVPASPSAAPVRDYSPWPTLLPRYWQPVLRAPVRTPRVLTQDGVVPERELLGFGVGAQTTGVDLVGRHAYGIFGQMFTSGGKAEGGALYSFAGLGNPVLALGASQFWDEDGPRVARPGDGEPLETLYVLERERYLFGSVSASGRRWRHNLAVTLSAGLAWEHRELLDDRLEPSTEYMLTHPDSRLTALQLLLSYSTARSHSFQLGGSRGIDLVVSGGMRRELSLPDSVAGRVGVDRSVDEVVGRFRAYLPLWGWGFAPHVLALQASGGVARGPNAGPGHFEVGGASGRGVSLAGIPLFEGASTLFAVRGYDTEARYGRIAWTATAEYRFPIALVHRGLGAWPLYLGRVVGSLFADAGNAWGPDATPSGTLNPRRATLASVGVEASSEILTFYDALLLTRLGVALPLVGGDGARFYVALGLPF